eukprot:scaffold6348_cov259-Pinguiococcus_pyrenoidosus.AAC.16
MNAVLQLGSPWLAKKLHHRLVGGQPDAPESDREVRKQVAERLRPLEEDGNWEAALALLADTHPER